MKPNLVIIVGAGASIPCGMPSTMDLTNVAEQSVREGFIRWATSSGQNPGQEPIGKSEGDRFLEIVHTQLDNPDFETILHALRVLEGFGRASRGTVAGLERRHIKRPALTAFATMVAGCDFLLGSGLVDYLYAKLVRDIHRAVGTCCVQTGLTQAHAEARSATASFFKRLSGHFRLIVLNLNYDSLIDDAIDWCDGFVSDADRGYAVFDVSGWQAACEGSDHLMIHLHGSVRYGYPEIPDDRLTSVWWPVRYDEPEKANRTLLGRSTNRTLVGDSEKGIFALVSGQDKAANLVHNTRPYGYYLLSSLRFLSAAERLLVIGYGGRDEHLNAWIKEFAQLHPARRIAVVLLGRNPRALPLPEWWLMKDLADDGFVSGSAVSRRKRDNIHLDLAGVPAAYRFVDDLVTHLGAA